MADHVKSLKESQKLMAGFTKAAPQVAKAFGGLHEAVCQEGALDKKTKELIAVGIAVSVHCVLCFESHITTALDAGATREEIIEAIGVGILMNGGPGYAYGIQALECLDQLLEVRKKNTTH